MVSLERFTAGTWVGVLTVCYRPFGAGPAVSLSPTKGMLVIRLRPRVGMFRALSVLVLFGGLAGGLVISDRKSQQRTTANPLAAQAAEVPLIEQDANDQKDAQAKATDAVTAAAAQANAAADAARKQAPASRSDTRTTPPPSGPATGGNAGPIPASCQSYTGNRAIGCTLMLQWGFGIDQAPCLVSLWNRESGWNPKSKNGGSGAYGIPQAVPGNKMAVYGADWQTNPVTQIKWGLNYIKGKYKTPCGAWGHSQSTGWY
jgi:hypothetical protein